MKRLIHWLLTPLYLVALCACATAPTLTFNDQITAAYTMVTTVAAEADLLATSGVISKTDATSINQRAQDAKAALDVANAAHTANATDGGDQLATALATLSQLNTSLIALQAPAK